MLLLCMFSVAGYGLAFQAIPPLIPVLQTSLGISHSQAGTLLGLFTLAGIGFGIPSGLLLQQVSNRLLGSLALLLMSIGTLLCACAEHYSLLLTGRLLAGIGGAALLVVAPQQISLWFQPGQLGRAMGLYNISVPIGSILALSGFGYGLAFLSWRQLLQLTAVVCLLLALLFALLFKAAPKLPPTPTKEFELCQLGWPCWQGPHAGDLHGRGNGAANRRQADRGRSFARHARRRDRKRHPPGHARAARSTGRSA